MKVYDWVVLMAEMKVVLMVDKRVSTDLPWVDLMVAKLVDEKGFCLVVWMVY